MRRLTLAAGLVFLLSACGTSRGLPPPSALPASPAIRQPPETARTPCIQTRWEKGGDGSLNSAQAEAVIRGLLFDLRDCDGKRRLAVDAWPKVEN